MEDVGERAAVLKDAEVGEGPGDVELDDVHAAFLVDVQFVVGRFGAVEAVLGAREADFVELLRDVEVVAYGELPDFAADARREPLPPEV